MFRKMKSQEERNRSQLAVGLFLEKGHENTKLTASLQKQNASAPLDNLFLAELMFSLVLNQETKEFTATFGKRFLNKIFQNQLASDF